MRDKGIDYLRIADAQLTCSNFMRSKTHSSSRVIATIAGDLPQAMAPGPDTIKVNGIERQFFNYIGRAVPYGPDDGTIAALGP